MRLELTLLLDCDEAREISRIEAQNIEGDSKPSSGDRPDA